LVTNILPPLTGSSIKAEDSHYLSIVDMLLVPCTDLVFQFACAEESTRLPQGLHLLYPNGPNIFRRGNQLWIRSPIGFVWRNLRYPAGRVVQLHPESFLLLDDGSVLVFRRAVLALHRSGSPVLRADVPSWYDESDSGVECDIGSAFVNV